MSRAVTRSSPRRATATPSRTRTARTTRSWNRQVLQPNVPTLLGDGDEIRLEGWRCGCIPVEASGCIGDGAGIGDGGGIADGAGIADSPLQQRQRPRAGRGRIANSSRTHRRRHRGHKSAPTEAAERASRTHRIADTPHRGRIADASRTHREHIADASRTQSAPTAEPPAYEVRWLPIEAGRVRGAVRCHTGNGRQHGGPSCRPRIDASTVFACAAFPR